MSEGRRLLRQCMLEAEYRMRTQRTDTCAPDLFAVVKTRGGAGPEYYVVGSAW